MSDSKPSNDEKKRTESSVVPEIRTGVLDIEKDAGKDEGVTTDGETSKQEVDASRTDDIEYPGPVKQSLILIGLLTGLFLVALDQTIIGVAIPAITNEFHTIVDVGWYGSAYFLTSTALQLSFGRIYKSFNIKYVFLVAIFFFELGSLICGVAPNSSTLIGGRAVAGIGVAGVFSGAVVIMAVTFPLEKRPLVSGLFGAMWGVSFIIGPLIGGALTDNASWRWCFYINLPIGAVSLVTVFFFVNPPPLSAEESHKPVLQRIKDLDLVGAALFMPAIVCLLLALQWGGNEYAWNNSRIIGLFVGFGVIIILFVAWQIHLGDAAMVPPRILKQRTVAAACLFTLCFGGSVFILMYYLPVFLQAVRGSSATKAGVQLLPVMVAAVFSSITSGIGVATTGYYVPWLASYGVIYAVGVGVLMHYWTTSLTNPQLIGLQVLTGLGTGAGFQIPVVAVQTVLSLEDVSIGSAAVVFFQNLGGALFIAVAQSVFQNGLLDSLAWRAPSLDPSIVIHGGATGIRTVLQQIGELGQLGAVVQSYVDGLQKSYQASLGLAVAAFFATLLFEWRSVKKGGAKEKDSQVVMAV